MIDTSTFDSLFATFERSAFRLEGLPRYCVEPEWSMFERWNRTGEPPDETPFPEWLEVLHQARSRGASVQRARTFTRPIDPFIHFECLLYEQNAAAGEDIRVVERESTGPDYWLLDDSVAGVMSYDTEGRFHGIDMVTEPAEIEPLVALRYELLGDAVPFHTLS